MDKAVLLLLLAQGAACIRAYRPDTDEGHSIWLAVSFTHAQALDGRSSTQPNCPDHANVPSVQPQAGRYQHLLHD